MAGISRGFLQAGLKEALWVVLFQQMDKSDGPVHYYRRVRVNLTAEAANAAAVTIKIQTSVDGAIWTTAYDHPVALQPGGEVFFSHYHTGPHVRCLVYSTGLGQVHGDWLVPEDQTLPYLDVADHLPLSCSQFCEQTCETGAE